MTIIWANDFFCCIMVHHILFITYFFPAMICYTRSQTFFLFLKNVISSRSACLVHNTADCLFFARTILLYNKSGNKKKLQTFISALKFEKSFELHTLLPPYLCNEHMNKWRLFYTWWICGTDELLMHFAHMLLSFLVPVIVIYNNGSFLYHVF